MVPGAPLALAARPLGGERGRIAGLCLAKLLIIWPGWFQGSINSPRFRGGAADVTQAERTGRWEI